MAQTALCNELTAAVAAMMVDYQLYKPHSTSVPSSQTLICAHVTNLQQQDISQMAADTVPAACKLLPLAQRAAYKVVLILEKTFTSSCV